MTIYQFCYSVVRAKNHSVDVEWMIVHAESLVRARELLDEHLQGREYLDVKLIEEINGEFSEVFR